MEINKYIHTLNSMGFKVYSKAGEKFSVWKGAYHFGYYSARELISFARNYFNRETKKILKKFTSRPNRRKTRQIINAENFDSIPKNKNVHKEDPWSWD